ncbi:hypothetical protein ACNF49_37415 [Actinomadura sp. ATCC 39365]
MTIELRAVREDDLAFLTRLIGDPDSRRDGVMYGIVRADRDRTPAPPGG